MSQNHPASGNKAKSRIYLKILVPLFSLLLPLLLAELALRLLVRPPADWTHQSQLGLLAEGERRYPASQALFASWCPDRPKLRHHNSDVLGTQLREYAYPQAKPAGTSRIIGLGDSFAWGWGMRDNRRTFFKLLECWLNKQQPQRPVEVINAAKPAASAAYYQKFMDEFGWRLQPDRVVIAFNLNDAYVKHASITVNSKSARRLEQEAGFWTRHSRLVRFVRERIVRKQARREFIANIRDAYLGAERNKRWERAQANLLAVARGCRQRGIVLQVVVFPLLVDLDGHYPFQAEVAEIVRFCRKNEIDCLDLLPAFLGKKPELLWIHPSDTHPNELAHRLVAAAIFHSLSRPGSLIPGG